MPELNAYYWGMNDNANVVITFNPGDECTIEVIQNVSSAQWAYEIVVNDQAYQNYIVAGLTLAEGYTLKDLQEYSQSTTAGESPPRFGQLKMVEIVSPMSRTFHGVTYTGKPIYFQCIVQTSTELPKILNEFEAIKVLEQ